MIRTLTLVSVLALVAGLAMGFFVAEARVKPAPSTPSNLVLEAKVLAYVKAYDLDPERTQVVRMALAEYDQKLQDLFRRLRASHHEEFEALAKEANRKIRSVLEPKKR